MSVSHDEYTAPKRVLGVYSGVVQVFGRVIARVYGRVFRVCDRDFCVYLACDRAMLFKVLTRGIDRAFTGSDVVSSTTTIQEYTGFPPVPSQAHLP